MSDPTGGPPSEPVVLPSWFRWPPNCCQTCTGWVVDKDDRWIGTCMSGDSLEVNTRTDARYRCPAFKRKPDADTSKPT